MKEIFETDKVTIVKMKIQKEGISMLIKDRIFPPFTNIGNVKGMLKDVCVRESIFIPEMLLF